jgi:transposase InsO family protein
VTLRLIEPGKPNQNAYIESFNGRFAHSTHRDQSVHAIVITGTTAS